MRTAPTACKCCLLPTPTCSIRAFDYPWLCCLASRTSIPLVKTASFQEGKSVGRGLKRSRWTFFFFSKLLCVYLRSFKTSSQASLCAGCVFAEGLGRALGCGFLFPTSESTSHCPSKPSSLLSQPCRKSCVLCLLTVLNPLVPLHLFLPTPLSQSGIVFIYVFVYSFDLSPVLKWQLRDVRHVVALFTMSPSSRDTRLIMGTVFLC